jgi:prolyl-tRNA synthetase
MLGQNFARQFDLKFQAESGQEEYAWNTSWGTSTRLVGGVVMAHGDDGGLVLPPRVAPIQVVIVPIYRSDSERALVMEKAEIVSNVLRQEHVRTHVDARDTLKPGPKFYEWELKGVPVRVEIGPRDVAAQKLTVVMRTDIIDGVARKESIDEAVALMTIPRRLSDFQRALRMAAIERRERNSHRGISDYGAFREIVDGAGGFVYAGWCGSADCEAKVKQETKATIRVIPDEEFRSPEAPARCMVCGAEAREEAVWARAY